MLRQLSAPDGLSATSSRLTCAPTRFTSWVPCVAGGSRSGYTPAGMILRLWVALGVLALAAPMLGGCRSRLETGYEPVRLTATPQQRRAFYAPPFSPEARSVPDREEEIRQRRPRPGY